MQKRVIAVSRTIGAGGETIGRMVSERLGWRYVDEEIVYRVKKRHHAGLIVRAPRLERVNELLDQYGRRFAEDFVAVAPPPERPE